jgi:cell division protein YceG involved in septum cleavage
MDLASVAFELGKARARTPAEYFVANQDGSTKFAHKLDEHNANVAIYRQQPK